MSIVDLDKYKKDRTPHRTGMVKCLQCKHEWKAVAPEEVYEFECPGCGLERGAWCNHQPVMQGDLVYTCSTCGGDYYVICKSPDHGIYHMCATCGRRSTPEE